MHEFECGHQECGSRLTASDKNFLMHQVGEHLQSEHGAQPTETLLSYLEATCVTESPSKPAK